MNFDRDDLFLHGQLGDALLARLELFFLPFHARLGGTLRCHQVRDPIGQADVVQSVAQLRVGLEQLAVLDVGDAAKVLEGLTPRAVNVLYLFTRRSSTDARLQPDLHLGKNFIFSVQAQNRGTPVTGYRSRKSLKLESKHEIKRCFS